VLALDKAIVKKSHRAFEDVQKIVNPWRSTHDQNDEKKVRAMDLHKFQQQWLGCVRSHFESLC
jgi:hypothetical protein